MSLTLDVFNSGCAGQRLATRYFFHHERPKTTAQFDLLDSGDRTTIDLDENWF